MIIIPIIILIILFIVPLKPFRDIELHIGKKVDCFVDE